MRFAGKVAAGFGGLMAVTTAIAALALVVLSLTVRRGTELIQKYAEDLMLVERLRLNAEQTVAAGRGYILHGEPE